MGSKGSLDFVAWPRSLATCVAKALAGVTGRTSQPAGVDGVLRQAGRSYFLQPPQVDPRARTRPPRPPARHSRPHQGIRLAGATRRVPLRGGDLGNSPGDQRTMVSRRLGKFQKRLLAELQAADGLLPRAELRQRFPSQAEDHSLHRALRSLERRKFVEKLELFGRPWIALRGPGYWIEFDRDVLRLATTEVRMLRTLAASRGVHLPELDRLTARLDTYKRAAK